MENKTNKIITLDNDREYFVNRQILYKGKTYYVTTLLKKEVDSDGSKNPEDEVVIFEENVKDGETTVRVLNDPNVAKVILEHL